MSHLHHSRRADYFRRWLALGCAALVLTLGLLAASPTLHARLHHDARSSSDDDGCAVVLFAGGVTAPLAMVAAPPVSAEWREFPYVSVTEIFLDSPGYLWQPERGPPLG